MLGRIRTLLGRHLPSGAVGCVGGIRRRTYLGIRAEFTVRSLPLSQIALKLPHRGRHGLALLISGRRNSPGLFDGFGSMRCSGRLSQLVCQFLLLLPEGVEARLQLVRTGFLPIVAFARGLTLLALCSQFGAVLRA